MENITCAAELKLAIREKQFQHQIQGQLLKAELCIIYDSLKPANLIKNTLEKITSSPFLINNMSGAIMALIGGYLSKKLAVGTSHNLFLKIMGSVLQFGVTNIVAQHPDAIKNFGQLIIEKLFHRNEQQTE